MQLPNCLPSPSLETRYVKKCSSSHIPNMHILSPKFPSEIESAMRYALSQNCPIAIRYPRGSLTSKTLESIDYTKSILPKMHREGKNIAILATGKSLIWAEQVCINLQKYYHLDCSLIEVPCIMPVPKQALIDLTKEHTHIVTIEDHILIGGFGTIISTILQNQQVGKKYIHFGYKNGIIEHGKVEILLEKHGLSPMKIADEINNLVVEKL